MFLLVDRNISLCTFYVLCQIDNFNDFQHKNRGILGKNMEPVFVFSKGLYYLLNDNSILNINSL